jgi:hypothetical protein
MRRTRHRRRFHTDRVVRSRRARYLREEHLSPMATDWSDWTRVRLSYGYLASRDPWDCGNARGGVCHYLGDYQRADQDRQWRRDWDL